jgi:hypothetical protein
VINHSRKLFFVLIALFGTGFWTPDQTILWAQSQQPVEYQVKAAVICNLLPFVEWPVKTTPIRKSSLTLYVLGENPFGAHLEPYQGEIIRQKRLSIRFVRSLRDVQAGDILFISGSEKDRLSQILKQVGDSDILTIGDHEAFGQRGVMVNFYIIGHKIRFEINVDAVRRSGLKINPEILKLAKIIKDS